MLEVQIQTLSEIQNLSDPTLVKRLTEAVEHNEPIAVDTLDIPLRRLVMGYEIARRRVLFAVKYHRTSKGTPLDFSKFPYLMQIYSDPAEKIILQTGTQTGKTEWVVCDALAIISQGLSYQNVQPKEDQRSLFLKTRIYDPIALSEYYSRYARTKGSLVEWRYGNAVGLLRVTFSTVPNEMIAFPADAIGVDEVDFCDLNNLSLLPDRTMGSLYRFERRTSTPTTVGHSLFQNINYFYERTDRKIWVIPCPKCESEQPLVWEINVVKEKRDPITASLVGFELMDSDWHSRKGRDIYPICRFCGHPLNRLAKGRWLVRNPDGDGSGYHLNKMYSPLITLSEMFKSYKESEGNPTMLQRFSNSYLGMPYQGVGDKITESLLNENADTYEMHGTNLHNFSNLSCSMGVDVGAKYLDVRISDHPGGTIRRARFIGKVDWADLSKLVDLFNVTICIIDEEPERSRVYDMIEKLNCRVLACCVRNVLGGDMIPDIDRVFRDNDLQRITIDKTIWQDRVQQSFVRRQNLIPANYRYLENGRYVLEMTTPVRVISVDAAGRQKFVWTSGNDHSFLADVFDLVATHIGFRSGFIGGEVEGTGPRVFSLDGVREWVTSPSTFEWD